MTATRRGGFGAPLFWQLFLASAAIVVAVLVVTLVLLGSSARQAADRSMERRLEETRRLVAAQMAMRERELAGRAAVFSQNPTFRALVLEQRPEDLLDQAVEATHRTRASWVQITDAMGVRLAKSDEPGAQRLELAHTALIGGALTGEPAAGAGITGDSALFQGVAVPIIGTTAVAGALMAARNVDSVLAREIERATESDIVFFLLDGHGEPRVAASTLPLSDELRRLVRAVAAELVHGAGEMRLEAVLGGQRFVIRGDTLASAGGEPLGGILALRSRAEAMAPFTALRDRLFLAGGLGLALACMLSFVLARGITRPILAMAEATRRAAAGELDARSVSARPGAELGVLAEAVRTMLTGVRERETLAALALMEEKDRSDAADDADATLRSTATLPAGAVLAGRYRIVRPLGVGGTGVVYKAMDDELGETIALKTLRSDLIAGSQDVGLERLRSEIRLARRITHANVVRIHDIGESNGLHFITMEFVAGTPLDRILARHGRLTADAALAVGRQLCRALQVAHEQGIVHRDIKPHNLIVQGDGLLKVLDFGIARLVHRTTVLTEVGAVVGTPAYMAPEQLLDEQVDERADVYAAGVVLYECVTGRRPIDATSPAAVIGRVLSETPPTAREVESTVPEALSAAIGRAMSRDRDTRPRSAAEFLELLLAAELRTE